MAANPSDLYEKFYTHLHPELGTGPVPLDAYISEDYFAREQKKIFNTAWMSVCAESEIPEVGDYIVKEVPILKSSIIIVRGKDGVVRAFRNACRHRGNQLIYEECRGKTNTFTCKFHAWNYGLEGNLRGLPDADRFLDFKKSDYGLTPVMIESWKGLVFVNRAEGKVTPLREYLGSLADELEGYPFEKMKLAAEWKAELDANWKTMVDAFQEGYHVSVVHKKTAPTLFNGGARPTCRLSHFRFHGNHRAFSTPKNAGFVPTSTEALAFQLSGIALVQKEKAQLHEEIEWKGLNPGNDPDFAFDVNVVFPATFIDTSRGWFFTYEFWPIAVDRTRWVTKFYAPPPKTWAQRIGLEFTIVQIREALLEDLSTIEATQRGMSSGAMTSLVLSDQELAIRHNHAVLERLMEQ